MIKRTNEERLLYGPKRVSNYEELERNMDTLDGYLQKGRGPEYEFAISLLKRGICFVQRIKNDEMRFYPSRFVGYLDNDINKHIKYREEKWADGKITNPAISDILGCSEEENIAYENEYIKYCNKYRITVGKRIHKFWVS